MPQLRKSARTTQALLIEQKPRYPCSVFSCQNTGFAVGKAQLPAPEAEALPFLWVAVGRCRLGLCS